MTDRYLTVRIDTERASGTRWPASDFNDKAAGYYRDHNLSSEPPTLTDDDLARIRQRRAELFAQWNAVAPGGTLELTFVPGREGDSVAPERRARVTDGSRRKSRTR